MAFTTELPKGSKEIYRINLTKNLTSRYGNNIYINPKLLFEINTSCGKSNPTYSSQNGLQFGLYRSVEARVGVGLFGGYGFEVSISQNVQCLSDLSGSSIGGGFYTPVGGYSREYSTSNPQIKTNNFGFGPGALGAGYGVISNTGILRLK